MTTNRFSWTFRRTRHGRFHVGVDARAVLLRYLQHGPRALEAGGVLIGRHLLGTEDIVADYVTTPMQGDKRTRFSFYRGQKQHQRAVDRAWAASGGVYTYLGEWHTHPESVPSPSCLDRREHIRTIQTARCSHPIFFLILGTETARTWEAGSAMYIREIPSEDGSTETVPLGALHPITGEAPE